MSSDNARTFRYTACYCEENIWYLCQADELSVFDRKVVFISSKSRCCPIWGQRSAPSPELPVWWDYHVILLCLQDSWILWDLDTLLGFPVPVEQYLRDAFRAPALASPQYSPVFRVVDADDYVASFSSDRSHMRTPTGEWLAPQPSWPAIMQQDVSNLASFIDMRSEWLGEVMNFDEFFRNFGREIYERTLAG